MKDIGEFLRPRIAGRSILSFLCGLLLSMSWASAGFSEVRVLHVTPTGAGTRDGRSWVNALGEAEFAEALSLADAAVVLDIYGAREQPRDGVTSQLIIDRMTNKVVHQSNFSLVPQTVAELAHPGDMVITMGAGDVTVLADEILFQLRTDD